MRPAQTPTSSGTRGTTYARWHLGLTEGAPEHTKARYAFVVGDFRRVHRSALIACVVPRRRSGATRRSSWPRTTCSSFSTRRAPEDDVALPTHPSGGTGSPPAHAPVPAATVAPSAGAPRGGTSPPPTGWARPGPGCRCSRCSSPTSPRRWPCRPSPSTSPRPLFAVVIGVSMGLGLSGAVGRRLLRPRQPRAGGAPSSPSASLLQRLYGQIVVVLPYLGPARRRPRPPRPPPAPSAGPPSVSPWASRCSARSLMARARDPSGPRRGAGLARRRPFSKWTRHRALLPAVLVAPDGAGRPRPGAGAPAGRASPRG